MQTYFTKLKDNPSLAWDGFISVYKNTEDYLFAKNILVEEIDASVNIIDLDCRQVEEVLRRFKSDATPDAIAHDAYMMLVTEQYRKKFKLDELGSKVWFLTLDYRILKSQKELKRSFADKALFILPTSAHISAWGARIGKYQNFSTYVYEDYISYLIRSKLGLIVVDKDGISVDVLELITKSIVDVKPLLSLPDTLVVGVVKSLQENEEARKLMIQIVSEEESGWKEIKQEQFTKMILDSIEQVEYRAKFEANEGYKGFLQQLEAINSKLTSVIAENVEKDGTISTLSTKIAQMSEEQILIKNENERLQNELNLEKNKTILERIIGYLGIRKR